MDEMTTPNTKKKSSTPSESAIRHSLSTKPEIDADHLQTCCWQVIAKLIYIVELECIERNWSIGTLASHCGVERTTLYRIMHGERVPSLETVIRLILGLGLDVSPFDLLAWKKEEIDA